MAKSPDQSESGDCRRLRAESGRCTDVTTHTVPGSCGAPDDATNHACIYCSATPRHATRFREPKSVVEKQPKPVVPVVMAPAPELVAVLSTYKADP